MRRGVASIRGTHKADCRAAETEINMRELAPKDTRFAAEYWEGQEKKRIGDNDDEGRPLTGNRTRAA